MGFLRGIVHFLTYFVYILILVYGLLCLPMIVGYKPLVVLTGSMEPTYPVGSIVYYHSAAESSLRVGDVITFTYNDLTITHRIAEIHEDKYVTKGDSNNAADPVPITFKNILGKVGNVYVPYLGYYVRFVNEHLYIVGVAVFILVSEFLLNTVKAFDINKKRKDEKNGLQ